MRKPSYDQHEQNKNYKSSGICYTWSFVAMIGEKGIFLYEFDKTKI